MPRFHALTSLIVAIALAALLALPAPAFAQEDLSQTYSTADGGLTFRHPAGWAVVEQFGTITLASSQAALDALNRAAALEPGQMTAVIVPPAGLAEQLALMGLSAASGPEALLSDYVTLLGASASFAPAQAVAAGDKVAIKTSGIWLGMAQALYAVPLGEGGLALIAAAASDEATLAAAEPPLLAIIGSFSARPLAAPVETASVVWQQQQPLPGEQVVEGGVNGFLDVVAGPDDTLYVLDAVAGVHIYTPDSAYQGLLGGVGAPFYFADISAGPDGTLWGVDYGGTVMQVGPDGAPRTTFSVTDGAGIAVSFNVQIAAGPDGNVYLLTTVPGATEIEQVGQVVVFDPAGQMLRRFEIGRADYAYDATIAFGPDGALYAVESSGEGGVRVFDTQGGLLREGIGAAVLFVGPGSLAVAPDGSIYVGAPATGAIYHFAPDGALLGRFGQSQFDLFAPEAAAQSYPPFEPGVFFEIAGLAVLSDGDVVAADANPSFAQLVRVSFD